MRIHINVKNTTWKITKGNKVRLIMIRRDPSLAYS